MFTTMHKDQLSTDSHQEGDATSSASSSGSFRFFKPAPVLDLELRAERLMSLLLGAHESLREGIFKLLKKLIKDHPKLANYQSKTLGCDVMELAKNLKFSNVELEELKALGCQEKIIHTPSHSKSNRR
jgi:hypothetical protein